MGYLPCLRRGSDRWWLPCSPVATETLGELLMVSVPGQPLSGPTRTRLYRAILADPPLMIFASLGVTGKAVQPMQLVDWLAEHAATRLSSGDAYLGAPPITASITKRWNRLRDHFRTLPIQRWLEDASLWLEVTGPNVPQAWKQQWPKVIQNEEHSDPFDAAMGSPEPAPAFHLLQHLARSVRNYRSVDEAFDHRLHRNKLAALKQLAYGLSHEINNPLANISTRAQQLQRGEEDPARAATLQRIVDQVYRAHEMIADLMFYANPPGIHVEHFAIGELLRELVDAYGEEASRHAIRTELNVSEFPIRIEADRGMIGEAVGVVIRNAIEAIGCQGMIAVSLEDHEDRVEIHVADSGPGLSAEARKHAFDPYFSGREAGRGLGLGLCRAYRVVRLHHGEITLAGGPAGCVATIVLPKTSK